MHRTLGGGVSQEHEQGLGKGKLFISIFVQS